MKKNDGVEGLWPFCKQKNLPINKNKFLISTFLLHFILVAMLFNGIPKANAQEKMIEVNLPAGKLTQAIQQLEKSKWVTFAYDQALLSKFEHPKIVGTFSKESLMRKLLTGLPLSYKVVGNRIAIFRSKDVNRSSLDKKAKPVRGRDTITVQGIVRDSSGNVLSGVTVSLKEKSSIATNTDQNGRFILDLPSSGTLIFSFLGFNKLETPIDGRGRIDIEMVSNQANLDEIVVVGFGIKQNKKSLVGAVETINAKDLIATSSNLSTSFAGRIAGVIATQGSGEPGVDNANFWIRGISTFGTNSAPLIVLDGVEITPEILNSIAPETIESFSVLKDATATALYGSRGANGVMIITTKNGANTDRMNVNARAQTTVSSPTKIPEIADGVVYMENFNQAYRDINDGKNYFSEDKINGTKQGGDPYIYPNNNWYDLMFKNFTINQNANINVTGGSRKVDYFLNAAYFRENGIYKQVETSNFNSNNQLNKFSFQSNVAANITPTTRIGVKLNSMLQYRYLPTTASGDLFYYAMRANPVAFPVTFPAEPEDDFIRYGNAPSWDGGATDINPVALLSKGYGNQYTSYLISIFNADQDLNFVLPGLKAKFLASFYNKTYSATYRNLTPFYYWLNADSPILTDENGMERYNTNSIGPIGTKYLSTSVGRNGYREYSIQGALEYNRTFLNAHNVNAILLYHQRDKVDNVPDADEFSVLPYREQGIAGRVTYDYKRRYLMEANFGYNGSENFMRGNRWGLFPSVAVGWNISSESFFEPLLSTVSLLKVRASWGKAGNDALSIRFPYTTTVTTGQNLNFYYGTEIKRAIGATLRSVGNPDATWEVSEKVNLGLELGLLNQLTLIVDVFRDNRKGIFMQRRSIPTTAGYVGTTPYANIGAVLNKGLDASLEYNKKFSKELTVSVRGTFTYAHNEVTARDEPDALIYPNTSRIGKPINSLYGLVSEGLFRDEAEIAASPEHTFAKVRPGDIKYRDITGDGKIDENDIELLGMPTKPEIMYGIGPSMRYKRMDFSFFLQGASRVSLLMSGIHPFLSNTYSGFGMSKWIADDHWSVENPNPNAAYPRLSATWNENNTRTSDFFVRDASYVRLKSAELGYTYKKLRVYALGTNLFTISKFKLWDPEIGGGNGLSYPLQKTYTLGLQYNF